MSWGTDETGTKEEVTAKLVAFLDARAHDYRNDEEGKDVLSIKARILAILPTIDGERVRVQANGSRSWGDKGTLAERFTLIIEKV